MTPSIWLVASSPSIPNDLSNESSGRLAITQRAARRRDGRPSLRIALDIIVSTVKREMPNLRAISLLVRFSAVRRRSSSSRRVRSAIPSPSVQLARRVARNRSGRAAIFKQEKYNPWGCFSGCWGRTNDTVSERPCVSETSLCAFPRTYLMRKAGQGRAALRQEQSSVHYPEDDIPTAEIEASHLLSPA